MPGEIELYEMLYIRVSDLNTQSVFTASCWGISGALSNASAARA